MDKLFEDSEMIVRRFPCGCLFPGHIMDVSCELADDKEHNCKRVIQCTLNLYMDGKAPLKWRLKEAFKLLKGQEGSVADLILREEDIPHLIEILSWAIPTTVTVSNPSDLITYATNVRLEDVHGL